MPDRRCFPGTGQPARLAALLSVVLGCSASTDTRPAVEQTPAEAAQSRERAIEITSRMLDAYRKAKSYADHATYIEQSVLRGEGISHELPYYEMSLAFERPNRLRLTFHEALADAAGTRRGFDVACNGELIRASMPEIQDQMVENPAPPDLTNDNVLADPLIRESLTDRVLGDVFPQLAMLLNSGDDEQDAVFPLDSNPRLLSDASVGDSNCYRVATSHPEGTRVFWIDRESYALRRMELPVEAHRQRIDPDGHFLSIAVRIDFEDVTIDAAIEPKSFDLAPKPGARRVRRFVLPVEDNEPPRSSEN